MGLVACGAAADALTDPADGANTGGGSSTPPPTSQPATPVFDSTRSFVRLVSDPGEYVGQGKTYLYTPDNAIIIVKADTGHLGVRIVGPQAWAGSMFFAGLSSLRPGTYPNLGTYDRYNTASGIEWLGDGACSRYTGSVTIDTVRYDGDSLSALDMTFEQRCESIVPLLHGKVHWRASDPFTRGPVVPIPASLWRPTLDSVPRGVNYAVFESDPGDPIGRGNSYLIASPASRILVNSNGGRFSATMPGFVGEFATMDAVGVVTYGYYPNVMLRDSHNVVFGGMKWRADGVAVECTTVNGWFAVDRVVYNSEGTVTSLDLRFEQHCNGLAAALRGLVHWNMF